MQRAGPEANPCNGDTNHEGSETAVDDGAIRKIEPQGHVGQGRVAEVTRLSRSDTISGALDPYKTLAVVARWELPGC